MNREIEIINGKLYVPLYGTIYVFTVAEAEELASQILSAIAAIRLTRHQPDAAGNENEKDQALPAARVMPIS